MTSKVRAPRLSPNKRAELISRYEKGESLEDGDYYVMKDKSGRLNVRRRKQKGESSSDDVKPEPIPEEPAKEESAKEEPKKAKKEPKSKAL